MSSKGLSRAQRQAAKVLGEALASEGFTLAGGAALVLQGVVNRSTDDLDSFSASCKDFQMAFDRAIGVLEGAGFGVKVDRRHDTFCRLIVSSGRLRQSPFGLDLGIDSITWGFDVTPAGPCLTVRELAANKVLAAFARTEPRDLYDLEKLSVWESARRMVADAKEKDQGFDPEIFSDMVARTLGQKDTEWPVGTDRNAVRSFCSQLCAEAKAPTACDNDEEPGPLGPTKPAFRCRVCNRPLTSPSSIAAGVGPRCAKKG